MHGLCHSVNAYHDIAFDMMIGDLHKYASKLEIDWYDDISTIAAFSCPNDVRNICGASKLLSSASSSNKLNIHSYLK